MGKLICVLLLSLFTVNIFAVTTLTCTIPLGKGTFVPASNPKAIPAVDKLNVTFSDARQYISFKANTAATGELELQCQKNGEKPGLSFSSHNDCNITLDHTNKEVEKGISKKLLKGNPNCQLTIFLRSY